MLILRRKCVSPHLISQYNMTKYCSKTGLTVPEQRKHAFIAQLCASVCRQSHNNETKVNAWIDDTVIPALRKSGNGVLLNAVDYFGGRRYVRNHLLYLWYLLQEENERATQHPFVTDEVFQNLKRGNLWEFKVPYEKVMDMYSL